MKNYRLFLIRHGRTRGNDEGLYIGKTDLPLTDTGRREIEEIKKAGAYPEISRCYCSPLSRAIQTAEILFPNLPDSKLLIVDDLREMDFGVFEGLLAEKLIELESYKEWLHGGFDTAPPNGESARAVLIRCYSAMEAIVTDIAENNVQTAAVITHAGIIANILAAFGLPKIQPNQISTAFGGGYLLNIDLSLWQRSQTFEIAGVL